MNPRAMLTQLSIGRMVFGGSLLVAPQLIGGVWLGRDGKRDTVKVLSRAFGARDAAMGAGTLAAMSGGSAALRPWLIGGLVSDGVDLLATLAARDILPRRATPLLCALAGGAIVAGAVNLASGDDAASPQPQA
jgi:hypothetical protein